MKLGGSRRFVGLDIGSHAIKVLEAVPSVGTYRILHVGSGETPPGVVKEGAGDGDGGRSGPQGSIE